MTARVPCIVIGCRRTKPGDPSEEEWICAKHWRAIEEKRRRAYKRLRKRALAGDTDAQVRCVVLWPRLKATAIERSVGI